ncbi:portal protein [Caulobacter segnis]
MINEGIDADLVKKLPSYSIARDNAVQQARDTVDETEVAGDGDALWTMRQVEVVEHYIRLKEDEQEKIYQVLTGGEADGCVLLRKQEVNAIQLSAITPFLVTHRFYGESIADKLIEIQRVRTSLMRMTMDSGYFALNQRSVIDMTMANEYT